MNLTLSEDQILIRDAVVDFLKAAAGPAALRRAAATPLGFEPSTWQSIAEQGWCGLTVAENHGGLGLGLPVLAAVQEACGQHLLASPFFASAVLATTLLLELASPAAQAEHLPTLTAGSKRYTAMLPSDVAGLAHTTVQAAHHGLNWELRGCAAAMPDAQGADGYLLLAEVSGEPLPGLFLLPAAALQASLTTAVGFDGSRRFSKLVFEDAHQGVTRLDAHGVSATCLQRATAVIRLLIAAEQLGAAQACLDLTVAYTAERKQFGRAIHGFQAIKHRCAEMMVGIENLRSGVASAAAAAEDKAVGAAGFAAECAALKALASDTLFYCAQEAIQLHGGVGFTAEYDVQLYFKRAQASSHWLGSADALRAAVGKPLLLTTELHFKQSGEATDGPLAALREQVSVWLQANLTGRFARLKHRGGPGDEEADPALRKEWEQKLAEGGWTGIGWPQAHGGRGMSIAEQVVFHEEYARAGGPGRMGHIGEGLLGPALIKYGSKEQQARFLPPILAGTEYWAQGYSEPNAGSDLANVQTRCWQVADGSWRVQGQKVWTSLAHESDWIFVVARSDPNSRGSKGLSFLLLPLQQPGIRIRPIEQMGGGKEFNEVFFDEAIAEAGHLVGAPGEGWKVAMGLLEIERGVSTLGQQMHFAQELDLVIAAARANGKAHCPHLQARIGKAWQGLKVLRAHALRMLAVEDQLSLGREALVYKYAWSNWHRDLGKLAMDVLGADGEAESHMLDTQRLQKLFFFSRADTIYGGTNEIQLNLIAERGLGMPREARPA